MISVEKAIRIAEEDDNNESRVLRFVETPHYYKVLTVSKSWNGVKDSNWTGGVGSIIMKSDGTIYSPFLDDKAWNELKHKYGAEEDEEGIAIDVTEYLNSEDAEFYKKFNS